jgi:subtilisin family serine protease
MHLRKIITLVACLFVFGFSQAQKDVPRGWHLADPSTDSLYGISLNKAYQFLKDKNKSSQTITVAVLDGGIDTAHEDLINIMWHNAKEIPGNGIDDDKNGYADDIQGWNFLGNKDGGCLKRASDEKSRVYYRFKEKFLGKEIDTAQLNAEDKFQYNMWLRASTEMNVSSDDQMEITFLEIISKNLKKNDLLLQDEMGKKEYTINTVEDFEPKTKNGKEAKYNYLTAVKLLERESDETNTAIISELDEYAEGKREAIEAKTTAPKDYRAELVKDNYSDINDKFYGNNNVKGPDAQHGTHVAGIIGAQRKNNIGIDGVADNIKIMSVRTVPNGDEYDKDIALAIFYAVDNGAKVINMSFGKAFSPEKRWVDSAVKYAAAKDVLIVHAAGNESWNIDEKESFPTPVYLNTKTKAPNFITVGASSDPKIKGTLAADFSNYGKNNVDVFAPGVKIYSTLPGNQYGNESGTSMAAPVVTGIAALIRSNFPSLSAQQVKEVIEKSVFIPDTTVKCIKPGTKDEYIAFSELSKTGGIVNAYNAVAAASEMELNNQKNKNKKNKQ